jgi:hypothetical protein
MSINHVVFPYPDKSKTAERAKLFNQITNQHQIFKGQRLVIHGPDHNEEVTVTRGPFKCGGNLCLEIVTKGSDIPKIVSLADLAVIRYENGDWNTNFWLGRH